MAIMGCLKKVGRGGDKNGGDLFGRSALVERGVLHRLKVFRLQWMLGA